MRFFRFYVYFCTKIVVSRYETEPKIENNVNYEELLESRNGAALKKSPVPFGSFYKKMRGQKYVNVVDLRPELLESLVFCDALTEESARNASLDDDRQMHFEVSRDSAGIYGVTISQGSYRTFEQLMDQNPAVVAGRHYPEDVVKSLLELSSYLHSKGVYHVCYSPSNIFARKGDDMPMLLFHGSAYGAVKDQRELYAGSESYVAPEVLDAGTMDSRSDIYSIGKFMEYLYRDAGLPVELKSVVKKATDPNPARRYQTAEQMEHAISGRKSLRNSVLMFVGAALVAILFFAFYFTMVPETEDIEFVKPVEEQVDEDLLDGGFDAATELGIYGQPEEQVDEKKMKEYEAKAEQIFRKQYAKEADRILSKVYSNTRMNESEKRFMSESQSMTQELVKAQMKIGGDAGLSNAKSQRIASEIIERITAQKKREMKKGEGE